MCCYKGSLFSPFFMNFCSSTKEGGWGFTICSANNLLTRPNAPTLLLHWTKPSLHKHLYKRVETRAILKYNALRHFF